MNKLNDEYAEKAKSIRTSIDRANTQFTICTIIFIICFIYVAFVGVAEGEIGLLVLLALGFNCCQISASISADRLELFLIEESIKLQILINEKCGI